MPLIHSAGDALPSWCELTSYTVVSLEQGATHLFAAGAAPRQKLFVGQGSCTIRCGAQAISAEKGANLDLEEAGGTFEVLEVLSPAVLVHCTGRWGDEVGGSGFFTVQTSSAPHDNGDPVSYRKETDFDNHFHDCDEYWILFEGRGIAVSEGKEYEVGPGDCIATGMGYHHDFPLVYEPVKAVYFETTLEGQKRRGHLWEHTHGPARPQPDRI